MTSDMDEDMTGEPEQQRPFIPSLRFPEFGDAGEWPIKSLRCLAKRQTQRNSNESITRVLTNSAEHGIVDQRDFFEKDIATQGNLATYCVVEKGDFVYNPRISKSAPVGPIGKNHLGLGVMSPLYTVFRFDGVNDEFFEHYFLTSHWHRYLQQVSNSGARHDRMAISNDLFMEMPIPAPSKAEQQKIADCLSSLDAVIAAEGEKLAALKDHKKGLMQNLFPRPERVEDGILIPAETTPRLRFPEFKDAGEWEWITVGQIAQIFKGKGISKADISVDGLQPCVRYGELYTTYGELIDDVASKTNVEIRDLFMSKKTMF